MGIFDLLKDSQGRPLESPRPMSRAQGAEQAALNAAQRSSMMEDVNFRRDLVSQLGFDAGRILTESPYTPLQRAISPDIDPLAAYFSPSGDYGDLSREDQVYMGPSVVNDPSILAHEFRHRGTLELMDHFGLTDASFSSPAVQSFADNYGLLAYDTLMGDNERVVEMFDRNPNTPIQVTPGVALPEKYAGLETVGDTIDTRGLLGLLSNQANTGYFSNISDRHTGALDQQLVDEFISAFPTSEHAKRLQNDAGRLNRLGLDDAYQNLNRAARDALMDQGRYNPQPGDVRPLARPYLPDAVAAQEDTMRTRIERFANR